MRGLLRAAHSRARRSKRCPAPARSRASIRPHATFRPRPRPCPFHDAPPATSPSLAAHRERGGLGSAPPAAQVHGWRFARPDASGQLRRASRVCGRKIVVTGLQYVIPSSHRRTRATPACARPCRTSAQNRKGLGPERPCLPAIDGEKMDHEGPGVNLRAALGRRFFAGCAGRPFRSDGRWHFKAGHQPRRAQ